MQEPERRAIDPLQVVDGDKQRRALGQVDHQPVEAMQRRLRQIPAAGAATACGAITASAKLAAPATAARSLSPATATRGSSS